MDETKPDLPRRGRRLFMQVLLGAGMVVAAIVLASGMHAFASWYASRDSAAHAPVCTRTGTDHTVLIQNGIAEPSVTRGKLCDALTIINKDTKLRDIAFGPHDRHIIYDGVTEQILSESQSLTVIMDKTGTYTFHDHIDDTSAGTFIVSAN